MFSYEQVAEARWPFRAGARKRRSEMSERQPNGVAIVVSVADSAFVPGGMPLDTGQSLSAPQRRRRGKERMQLKRED